jgi:hypothetical protein
MFAVTLLCLGLTLFFQRLICFRGSSPLASKLMIEMLASAPASLSQRGMNGCGGRR